MKLFRKVCIHTGHGKTGSSTIQKSMRQRKDVYIKNNILPLITKRSDIHALLKNAFCNENTQSLEELESLAKKSENEECLLISSENIPGYSTEALTRLKEFAENLSDQIEVIMYVRHPFTFSVSLCQTLVKNGQIDLDDFINNPFVFRAEHNLNKLSSVFGKKALDVRIFEKTKLFANDVQKDFLLKLGVEQTNLSHFEVDSINESLSLEAVLIANYIYKNYKDYPKHSQFLKEKLALVEGEKFFLPIEVLDKVKSKSEKHIRFLKEKFGIEFTPPNLNCYKNKIINTSDNQFIERLAQELINDW
ncbi:hypothetical protein Q4567_00135 [Aliiglaciecola sp. 2_MG-2023]|uniref:hypothetical protein n=1 Tax=unclassified Aliiglaciecola TaxID=2593648 RepID=UPI0026E42E3A|nr:MULTISPECIES: hypothetical protein [unclassified Aliiglaciecola]MDO6709115.1 hypothetical protein [Aliiglaciecola sp. 2_MG-2023]MDO6750263.1 hypothetical protein [Aliiglaciecola sp. 1_MG-2023]